MHCMCFLENAESRMKGIGKTWNNETETTTTSIQALMSERLASRLCSVAMMSSVFVIRTVPNNKSHFLYGCGAMAFSKFRKRTLWTSRTLRFTNATLNHLAGGLIKLEDIAWIARAICHLPRPASQPASQPVNMLVFAAKRNISPVT